jgi:hypothetical protein
MDNRLLLKYSKFNINNLIIEEAKKSDNGNLVSNLKYNNNGINFAKFGFQLPKTTINKHKGRDVNIYGINTKSQWFVPDKPVLEAPFDPDDEEHNFVLNNIFKPINTLLESSETRKKLGGKNYKKLEKLIYSPLKYEEVEVESLKTQGKFYTNPPSLKLRLDTDFKTGQMKTEFYYVDTNPDTNEKKYIKIEKIIGVSEETNETIYVKLCNQIVSGEEPHNKKGIKESTQVITIEEYSEIIQNSQYVRCIMSFSSIWISSNAYGIRTKVHRVEVALGNSMSTDSDHKLFLESDDEEETATVTKFEKLKVAESESDKEISKKQVKSSPKETVESDESSEDEPKVSKDSKKKVDNDSSDDEPKVSKGSKKKADSDDSSDDEPKVSKDSKKKADSDDSSDDEPPVLKSSKKVEDVKKKIVEIESSDDSSEESEKPKKVIKKIVEVESDDSDDELVNLPEPPSKTKKAVTTKKAVKNK